jgi:hypothetical protein
MRCPKHPEVWLYENMMETEGYCPKCKEWYPLEERDKDASSGENSEHR